MKTEKNILIAFILNLCFSVFEFIGGIFTGSVAIVSDAIHDFGDAAGIGISYFLEKKSKKQPDEKQRKALAKKYDADLKAKREANAKTYKTKLETVMKQAIEESSYIYGENSKNQILGNVNEYHKYSRRKIEAMDILTQNYSMFKNIPNGQKI